MKKTTIYDIAAECNVSSATVSRALGDSGYPVNKKTKALILETAKRLNYTPNFFGKGLKSSQNNNIGVIVPNISNPYYSTLLQGIYDHALKNSYTPVITNSYRDTKIEDSNINNLMSTQVAGIIIVSINKDTTEIEKAISQGFKVVVLEQDVDVDCMKVRFNFKKGGYIATQNLIDNNHKNIGFVGAALDRPSRKDMLSGYKKCLQDNNITVNEDYIKLDANNNEEDNDEVFEIQNGVNSAKYFIGMKNMPTAFVCLNDMTAFGLINHFEKNKIRVPEDVSVIGFDNIPFSGIYSPSLTTIDQSPYNLGAMASKMLIENLDVDTNLSYAITIEPKLVSRDTVKKIKWEYKFS